MPSNENISQTGRTLLLSDITAAHCCRHFFRGRSGTGAERCIAAPWARVLRDGFDSWRDVSMLGIPPATEPHRILFLVMKQKYT